MKGKARKGKKNLLNYVPTLAEGVRYSDGVIYSPLARGALGKLYLSIKGNKRVKKTYLDEVGRFVVERMDGKRDVRQISEEMRERFGERVEPVYYTLAIFIRELLARKIITMKYPEDVTAEGESNDASRRKDKRKQKQPS